VEILNPDAVCVIENSVVVTFTMHFEQVGGVRCQTSVRRAGGISGRAHIVFDFHQEVDELQEGRRIRCLSQVETTKECGPALRGKISRNGLRVGDLKLNY
jgi:adenylosuccinate synthase